jgi:hypothetical protein
MSKISIQDILPVDQVSTTPAAQFHRTFTVVPKVLDLEAPVVQVLLEVNIVLQVPRKSVSLGTASR